jgi:hypothetical protein
MTEQQWKRAQARAWGKRFADGRKAAGFATREAFARHLESEYGIVVSATAVGMWERGETTPNDWHRIYIARAIGRHEAELFAYTVAVPAVAA